MSEKRDTESSFSLNITAGITTKQLRWYAQSAVFLFGTDAEIRVVDTGDGWQELWVNGAADTPPGHATRETSETPPHAS